MPVPDFSPGEVLTASAMDAIGMWRVGGGALSTATTNFAGVFTSNYTNYRIVIDSPATSGAGDFYLKFLYASTGLVTTANNYYWAYRGLNSSGGSQDINAAATNQGYLGWSSPGAGGAGGMVFDIISPFLTNKKAVQGQAFSLGSGVYISRSGGFSWDASDSFSGFQITSATAVTLTGNVSVYGYRKA
jgi:hypothetical protein